MFNMWAKVQLRWLTMSASAIQKHPAPNHWWSTRSSNNRPLAIQSKVVSHTRWQCVWLYSIILLFHSPFREFFSIGEISILRKMMHERSNKMHGGWLNSMLSLTAIDGPFETIGTIIKARHFEGCDTIYRESKKSSGRHHNGVQNFSGAFSFVYEIQA